MDGSALFDIRPLSSGEIPAAAEVMSAWMQHAFKGRLPAPVLAALSPERCFKRLSAPARTLAAFRDDDLVALGQADGAEITLMYSAPEVRGQGAGAAMLACLLDAIREAGYAEAWLVVLVENKGARRFYERHGGRPIAPDNVHLAGVDLPHLRYVFPLDPHK